MNPYLLFMILYALLITPVTLELRLSGGGELRYRLTVRVSGMPVFAQSLLIGERDDQLLIRERHLLAKREQCLFSRQSKRARKALLSALKQAPVRRALRGAIHLDRVILRLHIDSANAASTELLYSAVSLALQTAYRVNPRLRFRGSVTADFQGKQTQAMVAGIIRLHLGKIGLVGLIALAGGLTEKWRKGKQGYATSH